MNGKTILCLGDSNTWGYDPRSYFGSQYPEEERWTGILEKAGWRVINAGRNGLKIPRKDAYPVWNRLIRSKLPVDTVTVMLGSNDLYTGANAEETARRMEGFLTCVQTSAPGTRVILIAPPPMHLGGWVQTEELPAESGMLGEYYRQLAGEAGVEYADAGEWDVAVSFDGIHFSPEGHRAFAEGLRNLLAELPGPEKA